MNRHDADSSISQHSAASHHRWWHPGTDWRTAFCLFCGASYVDMPQDEPSCPSSRAAGGEAEAQRILARGHDGGLSEPDQTSNPLMSAGAHPHDRLVATVGAGHLVARSRVAPGEVPGARPGSESSSARHFVTGKQIKVQTACDRCTQGVMDADNPHLYGECACECHKGQA